MSNSTSIDNSNLLAARRLLEMAKQADARRSGKTVKEKSALEYMQEDQALISAPAFDAQKQEAAALPQIENINVNLSDLRNVKPQTGGTATVSEEQSIQIEFELRYRSNTPLDGLLIHDRNYAESDRYLFKFADGATFTILDKWTSKSTTVWGDHQTSRYGIFDVTQPIVQKVLSERAKEFIRRYKPDLIKFDFGYELPSLDVAAPTDMNWAGERLLQKGLEVVVGAMKEENPNLVIMYYGLSPLLIEYYDLHSPDDLVYCIGDYDLETNRRVFFSSLCGELGMPTYSSSGYEWESAPDIWFDTIASGTLGSLHCFDGDESGGLPTDEVIAKFNGLAAIARKQVIFQTYPVHAKWQGGLRAGFSPSWERIENDKTVLLALRTHHLDGKPAPKNYKDILHTDVTLVVASLTDDGISESLRIGIVPFGDGSCTISHTSLHNSTTIIEHYFSGHATKTQTACSNSQIEIKLQQTRNHEILEWIEIIFEKE